ncbi:MAG: hypothetical protein JW384_01931 [Nitrosomonadaceae bacterium]|nr:hypothetical protein [Nitrosomonadaceae bacterium]
MSVKILSIVSDSIQSTMNGGLTDEGSLEA